jgi:hypothetical protein
LSARLNNHIGEIYDLTKSDAAVFEAVFSTFDLLYIKCGGARTGYLEPARKYYDRVELQVLRHFLNDAGKQKLDRFLASDAALATQDDRAIAKLLGMELSAPEPAPDKPVGALIQAFNGTLTSADASVIQWIRDAAREGVQPKRIDELFELAEQMSGGDLDRKSVVFEKSLWTTFHP